MDRRQFHTAIKMTIAATITTALAMALRLDQTITAGILAVLSIQLTRKDSFILAGKRLANALLALLMGTGFFLVFGYDVWVFFPFTFAFAAMSFILKIEAGIVPSLVLASHLLLAGGFDLWTLFNSAAIIALAVAVSLALNLLYPLNTHKVLIKHTAHLDELLRKEILQLARCLREPNVTAVCQRSHEGMKLEVEKTLNEAELLEKDILFDRGRSHVDYLYMRKAQSERLTRLFELAEKLNEPHAYATPIADYLEGLAEDIGLEDRATPRLKALRELLQTYREKPLPEDRASFEARAVLFQMLFELEAFLSVKINFHAEHADYAKRRREAK